MVEDLNAAVHKPQTATGKTKQLMQSLSSLAVFL
jgi:hypothetical protein